MQAGFVSQLENGRETVAQLFWVNHFSIKCEYDCAQCPVKFETIRLAQNHSSVEDLRAEIERRSEDHPHCVVAVSQSFPHSWTRYVWRFVFMIATDRGTSSVFAVKRSKLGQVRQIASRLCRASVSIMARCVQPLTRRQRRSAGQTALRKVTAGRPAPQTMARATPWLDAGSGH